MKQLAMVGLCALSLWSCGPDAEAFIGDGEFDADVTQGELSSNRARSWLPLQAGNEWRFTSGTSTRAVQVLYSDADMALVSGLFDGAVWLGTTSSSSPNLLVWDGSAWQPLVRFGYASTTWKVGEGACTGLKARRTATGAVVDTALRTFEDTRTIGYEQLSDPRVLCAPPALKQLVFAANVGLVSFTTGRGETFTLTSARVAGKAVQGDQVTATLRLDKSSYVSKPNTIRCITTPCPTNEETAVAKLAFELRNTGTTTVRYDFRTGCQLDVEVYSAEGRLMRQLLEGRSCTMALTSLTLAPGQTKTLQTDLDLADALGQQLEGTFKVRAFLIDGANRPQAQAAFSVRIVTP